MTERSPVRRKRIFPIEEKGFAEIYRKIFLIESTIPDPRFTTFHASVFGIKRREN